MRIKTNNSYFERPSQIREPKSKHFLIFEGTKTEEIYFNTYLKKNNVIGDVYFFLRDKDKESWSNPKKIMDLLIDVINGNEKISFTYDTIFSDLYEYMHEFNTVVTKKVLKNKYIGELKKQCINQHDAIDIDIFNKIINKLIRYYAEKYKIEEVFHDEQTLKDVIEQQSTFNQDIDKIYLIVDRDKKSFDEEQYDYIMKKIIDYNVKFYVINPCFEFWLLLHYKDCLEYSNEQLINNDYVHTNNTFVYEELKKCDSSYSKTKFESEKYIDRINIAIDNAKKFETDIHLLKDNVGTNLGFLFEDLKKIS